MSVKLFSSNSTESDWKTLGTDLEAEIIDIDVVEHLNQSFSVTMTFDIDSELGNLINFNDIIVCTTNNIIDGKVYCEEPFRVKSINKDITTIEVYAEHRIFDLADNLIEYCSIDNLSGVLAGQAILNSAMESHDFSFDSTITSAGTMVVEGVDPITAFIGENGYSSAYNADIVMHNNTIKMMNDRGSDRGVVIEYGKDLLGVDYSSDFSEVYTRVIPSADNGKVTLPEKTYDSPNIGKYPHPITRKIEFNDIKVKSLNSNKSKLNFEFTSQEDGNVTFEIQLGKFENGYKIHEISIEEVSIIDKDSNSNLVTNGDFKDHFTDWELTGISDAATRSEDNYIILPIGETYSSSRNSFDIKHTNIPITSGKTYKVEVTLNSTIVRKAQVIVNSANKAYINETVDLGSSENTEGFDSLAEAIVELRNSCERLFTVDKVDEPKVTIDVECAVLTSTEEFKDSTSTKIWVGDTIGVKYSKIGLDIKTRCIESHFNPINKEVTSFTIGNEESFFSTSVSESMKNDQELIDKIENLVQNGQVINTDKIVQQAVDEATNIINDGLGGYVVKTRDEILVMDTDNKDTAMVITRMNKNGIAVSTTGYGGPWYGLVTGGKLVVNEATCSKFTASLINAGILKSVDSSSWFDLENGTFSWANGQLKFDGTELTIGIEDTTVNDLLNSTFNVLVDREHIVIPLDSNSFPVDSATYTFKFTVLKGNTTTETPCLVTKVTPKTQIDGVSFTMKNNTCSMVVDNSKRFLGINGDSFEVTLETLDYTLSKTISWSTVIQGRDGKDGVNGTPGTSSYFHVKYSTVPNPTSSSQLTEVPSDYIGTYVDSDPTDSTDPTKYTWSRFKGYDGNQGEQGTPGINGTDGKTYYLHIKYSNDGKTFTDNNGETPGEWLGQYVDNTEADSTTFSKYTWAKIKGDSGANASYVRIDETSQVFLKANGATSYSPSSIKLTPVFTNSAYSKWQYSTNNGTSWTNVTSGSNGLTISNNVLTIANTCSLYTNSIKSILFKVVGTNSVSDTITIVRIEDGLNGNDSVNVILGNECHTFAASSDGAAVATKVVTSVVGYKGTTKKACTIGTISGLPTGMTASISSNGTTSASVTFTVTTDLTTKNGTVTIPVTCEGVTINKVFSYSLAVAGTNGINGTNGTNAISVRLNASTNVFKSTDGGVTFSPSYIDFKEQYTNCTYSSWQYSTDGGQTWVNEASGIHGFTNLDHGIRLSCTSDLFNTTVTAITIRINTNVSTVYDTLTVYKLYDRTDINSAFEQMKLSVTQSNTKWEAAFRNANANNMFKNSDAKTGTIESWSNNGGGLYIGKADGFPFYGGIENEFRTSFPNGFRYGEDLPLEPNTDYVYEAYIYTGTDIETTNVTPLHFWIWKGTTVDWTQLCTIKDYRQTLTAGRFNKVYVHFTTDDVSETLYGRFFIHSPNTSDYVTVKRLSLKRGTVETEWTQHPNEVFTSGVTITEKGLDVKNGKLSVTNNSGEVVWSADNEGNMVMKNGKFLVADSSDKIIAKIGQNNWMNVQGLKVFGLGEAMQNVGDGARSLILKSTNGGSSYIDFCCGTSGNTYDTRIIREGNGRALMMLSTGLTLQTPNSNSNYALEIRSNGEAAYIDFSHSVSEDYSTRIITYAGDSKLHVVGGLIVDSGTKSAMQSTENYGNRLMYAVEACENYFEDTYECQLINGECVVQMDKIFLECVNTKDYNYYLNIDEWDECEGLYAPKSLRSWDKFVIKEKHQGTSNIEFAVTVRARRKDYEDLRLEEVAKHDYTKKDGDGDVVVEEINHLTNVDVKSSIENSSN